MSDDKQRLFIARGNAMREWAQGDGGLFAVLAAVKGDYLKTIEESEPAETQVREDTYHRIRALADIHRVMSLVITEGANAEEMLKASARKAEKQGKSNVA